jgi:nucleotide-binding universal stress UspA family protein
MPTRSPRRSRTTGAFVVLIATDGRPESRAALDLAAVFPWPAGARAVVVTARGGLAGRADRGAVSPLLDRALDAIALQARTALAARWPDAEVAVVPGAPVAGLVAEARRRRAGALVLAPGGRGRLSRLLLGSVSRGVARGARCPVLVVKGGGRAVRRMVVGLDDSRHARQAVDLVRRLPAPPGGQVTLVAATEPVRIPSTTLLPASARAVIHAEAQDLQREQEARMSRAVAEAAARLAGTGWRVERVVRQGAPLATLLAVAAEAGADLLVVGARGTGGLEGLLLGSVADGALHASPVPVLLVR